MAESGQITALVAETDLEICYVFILYTYRANFVLYMREFWGYECW